jgi:hypothetical protein
LATDHPDKSTIDDPEILIVGETTVYKFGRLVFGMKDGEMIVEVIYPQEGPAIKQEHGTVAGSANSG